MEESHSFVPLLIVALLSFAVPLLLRRFKGLALPVVVGEILAGIIVGDSGLKLVGRDPILEILAFLGFAYLMFLSGLEVDFEAVLPKAGVWQIPWKERLRTPLVLGVLMFGLTVGLALAAGLGLAAMDAADDPWLMALILSTTSLGIVMPVLKERGLTTKPYGQALLIAAVIADFATMLLVSVYVVVRTGGLSPQVLLVLLLFGAFLTMYRMAKLARRRLPGLGFLDNLSDATAQIDVRGAFTVGLAFIALAQGLGVEMILGAFLGGALISLLGDRHGSDLHHRLDVIGFGFFLPMFFIMVGVRFDVGALLGSPSSLLLLPVLVLLAYAVKMIPALVYRLGYSRREALAGGALLSSRLSLIIAVAAIGLQMGSIDAATNSALILVAIVTSTFSPLMFNGLIPAVSVTRGKFVIVGLGHEAELLAKRVSDHGEQVTVVVQDTEHPLSAEEPGWLSNGTRGPVVVMGDECDVELWESLDPDAIQAVAMLLPEDDANLAVCRLLRERIGIGSVVSLVHDATRTREFTALGIRAVNPTVSPVVELENLMLYPTVSSLMADLEDEHDVAEVRLSCTEMAGRPLKELDLSDGAMVILVRRNGDVIYPRGSTVLQLGDQLTLVGSLEAVRDLARRCGQG